MLESLVRYDMDLIPRDLYMAAIEIPADAVEDLPAHQLPAGWRNVPPPPILQQVGLRWLNRGQALCLRVPSAVNPHEFNVLINPVHPHFQEVKVVSTWSLTWDERFQPRP
jgi:RES domain-containing protein